jgi:hypothetical protein
LPAQQAGIQVVGECSRSVDVQAGIAQDDYADPAQEDGMNHRVRNLVVGAAVLIGGIVGLFLPVTAWSGGSSTVACGNAVFATAPTPTNSNVSGPDTQLPDQLNARPDYRVACDQAISSRRHWAIPLTVVGTAGVLVGLLYRGRKRN